MDGYNFDMLELHFLMDQIRSFNHRTSLMRWSLLKYKCLQSVGGKSRGSNFQERISYIYILRLFVNSLTNQSSEIPNPYTPQALLVSGTSRNCNYSPRENSNLGCDEASVVTYQLYHTYQWSLYVNLVSNILNVLIQSLTFWYCVQIISTVK